MSKDKRPPEEGKDEAPKSASYVEIDFSRIKDKLGEGLERIADVVDRIGQKNMIRDIQTMSEEGRVGMDPSLSRNGYGLLVCVAVMWIICLATKSPLSGYALCGLLILPAVAFILLGKYEIRYDSDGFTIRMGKKELHRHLWTDVTDVRDGKKIYVQGKRLFVDSWAQDFDCFYHRARSACKGKGKPTPPTKKKSKNRKKNSR